jgi:hypothetical protein
VQDGIVRTFPHRRKNEQPRRNRSQVQSFFFEQNFDEVTAILDPMAYLEPAPIAFTLFQPTHDALRLEKAIRFHNYMHLVARTRINKLIHYDDKPIANPHRTAPHR